MSNYLAKEVAYEDKIVKTILKNIKEKEINLLQEYIILNEFKKKRFDDDNDIEKNKYLEFYNYITKELELRKEFILYKKISKENQHLALLKILEYINLLECKNKELEKIKILSKIELLENELNSYKQILM
tara:strand:+ start:1243 stop:1632 length:390 start_codon:yes stop_codon:yes gene_type:complete